MVCLSFLTNQVQSTFLQVWLDCQLQWPLPVGLLEVIGSIALMVGVLTRIASFLFVIEMSGSTIVAKLPRGFVGGYEVDLLLMAISISLLLTGPGRISVEWNILKRELFPKGKEIVLQKQQQ